MRVWFLSGSCYEDSCHLQIMLCSLGHWMMEAVYSSKMLILVHMITQHHIVGDIIWSVFTAWVKPFVTHVT